MKTGHSLVIVFSILLCVQLKWTTLAAASCIVQKGATHADGAADHVICASNDNYATSDKKEDPTDVKAISPSYTWPAQQDTSYAVSDNLAAPSGGQHDNQRKRSQHQFMRFGRDVGHQFLRFGRDNGLEHKFMRFGRDSDTFGHKFMRFGRSGDNLGHKFMRFGRSDYEDDDVVTGGDGDSYVALDDGDSDVDSDEDPFQRTAKDMKHNFMRFGRSGPQDNAVQAKGRDFVRFGRIPEHTFMRFGRSVNPLDDGGATSKRSSHQFMRFGRK